MTGEPRLLRALNIRGRGIGRQRNHRRWFASPRARSSSISVNPSMPGMARSATITSGLKSEQRRERAWRRAHDHHFSPRDLHRHQDQLPRILFVVHGKHAHAFETR